MEFHELPRTAEGESWRDQHTLGGKLRRAWRRLTRYQKKRAALVGALSGFMMGVCLVLFALDSALEAITTWLSLQ
ncbi:MAG: hypothetical protein KDD89_01490 [Anaerolineales bacterium]|nr:hypothetical protein [Anaerolineales bacterium]